MPVRCARSGRNGGVPAYAGAPFSLFGVLALVVHAILIVVDTMRSALMLHLELAVNNSARCMRALLDSGGCFTLNALCVAHTQDRVRAMQALILASERLVLILAAWNTTDRRDGLHVPWRARAVVALGSARSGGVGAIRAWRALNRTRCAECPDWALLAAKAEVEAPQLRLVCTCRALIFSAEILPFAELEATRCTIVALCGTRVLGELARRARRAAKVGMIVHAYCTTRGRGTSHNDSNSKGAREHDDGRGHGR